MPIQSTPAQSTPQISETPVVFAPLQAARVNATGPAPKLADKKPTPGHADASTVARAPAAGTPVRIAPTTPKPPAPTEPATVVKDAEPPAVPAVPQPGAATVATQAPSDFRATPPAIQVPSAERTREVLSQGEAFAPDVAAALANISDTPMSAGGVAQFFAPILPNATWVVSGSQVTKPGARFCVSAVDRTGRLAMAFDCDFAKLRGDVVELHLSNQHTDKMYRGWGLTALLEQRTGALLQALSAHPDSRITTVMRLGNSLTGAGPSLTNSFQQARRGYLFADTCNVTSPFFPPAEKNDVHGLRIMRAELLKWAFSEPSLAYDGKQLTSGQRRAIRDRLIACRFPSDFADLDLPGYTATLGDDGKTLPLGQAFMRSGHAPAWCGVRYLNAPSARTSNGHQLMRGDSAGRFLQVAQRELRYAAERRAEVTQTLWTGFNSPDAEVRAETYKILGSRGEASIERYLRERRKRDPDQTARHAAKDALRMLRGETIEERLQQTIAATDNEPLRAGLQERLDAMQG